MDLKQAVLSQLNKGKEKALRGETLCQRLGQKDSRKIRLLIQELIADGQPICSTPHPPYGYFLAETPEEVKEALIVLRSYGKMIFLHYRDLKRAGQKAFPLQPHSPEQLSLSLKI